MIQHVLEHARVALRRHGLEGVGEIAVVGVGSGWHPRRHRAIQLGRIKSPLLAGVAPEEFLIEVPPHFGDNHVLRGADRLYRLCLALQERGRLFIARQIEAVEPVQGVPVNGDWQQLAVDVCKDAVLVWPPAGESRQVLEHVL